MYIDLSFKTLFVIWAILMLLNTPVQYIPFTLIIIGGIFIIGLILYISSLLTIYVVINPHVVYKLIDRIPEEVKLIFSVLFLGSIMYVTSKNFDKKAFIKIMQEELSMPTFKKIFSIFKKRK